MADPKGGVITERGETPWRDCTYASGMMMHRDAGGFFPLSNLNNEREALERSDDRPDETGANLTNLHQAMNRRYRAPGRKLTTSLETALKTRGTTLVVQGVLARFAAGHRLRRWDPDFTGGHAVAVRVCSDGTLTWLDPLATAGFVGDKVTIAQVLKFAYGRDYARVLAWGESRMQTVTVRDVVVIPGGRSFTVKTGIEIVGWDPNRPNVKVKVASFSAPSSAQFDRIVDIAQSPVGTVKPNGQFLHVTSGGFAGLYVPVASVLFDPTPVPDATPYTKEDLDAAVLVEDAKWEAWVQTAPVD